MRIQVIRALALLLSLLPALLCGSAIEAKNKIGGPMPVVPTAQRYMAIGNAILVGIGTVTPAQAHSIFRKQVCTANWAVTSLEWTYGGFTVQTGGQNPAEIAVPNNYTVDFAEVEYPTNTFTVATFGNGASQSQLITSATSGARTDAVSVAIPANTCYFIWTAATPATSGVLPTTSTFVVNGEGTNSSASPYTPGVATSLNGFGNMLGPYMVVARGWDGTTPEILAVGDSICQQYNDFAPDARGNAGYVRRGFDDNTVGPRYGLLNLCISGTEPSNQASATPGNMGYRLGMLALLPNAPYTSVFSEMGVNSVGDGQPAFGNEMIAWWAFLHGAFPYVPVIQATLTPNTQGSATYGGSADGYTTAQGAIYTLSGSATTSGNTSTLPVVSTTVGGVTIQPGWYAYNAPFSFITQGAIVTGVSGNNVTITPAITGAMTAPNTFTAGSQLVNSAFSDCNQTTVNARCTENETILANAVPHLYEGVVDITSVFWANWSNPVNTANAPTNSYWVTPNFSTTLAGAVTGGSTNPISMTAKPNVGDFIVLEPGNWIQTTTTASCTPSTCTGGTVIPVATTSSITPTGTYSIVVGDYAYAPSSSCSPATACLPNKDTVCGVSGNNITLCNGINTGATLLSGDIIQFGKQEPFRPFTTGGASAQTVLSVTGSGPFSVTLTNPPILSHSNGAAVGTAWQYDAVHPSGSLAASGGPTAIGAAKNAGVFK